MSVLVSLFLAGLNYRVLLTKQSVSCLRICLPLYVTFPRDKLVLTVTYEVSPDDIPHHVP